VLRSARKGLAAWVFGRCVGRVVFLLSAFMILSYFSSQGWQSWDVEHRPVIPESMPVLIDDDLLFEDGPAAPRPASVINRWLRLLPASGAPAPSSWENYARAVKEWTEFLAEHGISLFDTRDRLKAGLSRYAEHRAAGPVTARFAATTWGQHMSIRSYEPLSLAARVPECWPRLAAFARAKA
jgi:hypothetical protein